MTPADIKLLLDAATPGPWEMRSIENDGDYGGGPDCGSGFSSYGIASPDGKNIVDTLNSELAEVHEEPDEYGLNAYDAVGFANAALIAAAPTLAAAYIEQAATIANAMIECSLVTGHGDTIADLAAQIPPQVAELRATIARLTEERDRLREAAEYAGGRFDEISETCSALYAERDRLREALRKHAIVSGFNRDETRCKECDASWLLIEQHKPGCLAALKEG